MKEEQLKGLTKEQIAKVKACKNGEEILALAKSEGVELTDEQLTAVNGGCNSSKPEKCPHCGSTNVTKQYLGYDVYLHCEDCGNEWY